MGLDAKTGPDKLVAVFMGTPEFAATVLEHVLGSEDVTVAAVDNSGPSI